VGYHWGSRLSCQCLDFLTRNSPALNPGWPGMPEPIRHGRSQLRAWGSHCGGGGGSGDCAVYRTSTVNRRNGKVTGISAACPQACVRVGAPAHPKKFGGKTLNFKIPGLLRVLVSTWDREMGVVQVRGIGYWVGRRTVPSESGKSLDGEIGGGDSDQGVSLTLPTCPTNPHLMALQVSSRLVGYKAAHCDGAKISWTP